MTSRSLIHLSILSFLSTVLTACGAQNSNEVVFKKAEGYTCTGQVIPQEYLVRYKNGDIKIVKAENDDSFEKDFFETNKDELLSAEPNYSVNVKDVIRDSSPMASAMNYDNWGPVNIQADSYWTEGQYGGGIVIAVIDTGVDIMHPQLQSRIYKNAGEMGFDSNGVDKRFNGVDDDSNGLADDWAGYDFANNRPLAGDNSDHGTHVAGIIAASHSSTRAGMSSAVQGVAPQARILPAAFLDSKGKGSIEAAIRAIRYSVSRGAKIINASWGGQGCSVTLRDEVRNLQALNILFVSAAGNSSANLDTWPEYPASFEGLSQLTVGSINFDLEMSDFSNYSSRFVNLFAPGGGITSTVPGGYQVFSGTSMATPFVAGAAALIWAKNPQFSAIDVRNKILSTVTKQGKYENNTQGRVTLRL